MWKRIVALALCVVTLLLATLALAYNDAKSPNLMAPERAVGHNGMIRPNGLESGRMVVHNWVIRPDGR